jgi:hypothetical protein
MDIFHDPSKSIPKQSGNIVRVGMDELEIGGRKSHLPPNSISDMSVSHVPSTGKGSG